MNFIPQCSGRWSVLSCQYIAAMLDATLPRKARPGRGRAFLLLALVLLLPLALSAQANGNCDPNAGGLVLTQTGQNWQFIDAVGQKSALLGREDGSFEAWIYPLQLLRNFRLTFSASDRAIPADTIPRTVIVRPESTSIHYIYDSFSICETWLAPVHEAGAVVTLEVESAEPLTISAAFQPDVALMWPAGLGDGWMSWDENAKVFRLGQDNADPHRFYAVAGAANISNVRQAYSTNYSSAPFDTFVFGAPVTGKATYRFAMALSFEGAQQAQQVYESLLSNADRLQQESREYYEQYLARTISVTFPDRELQTAYDWARISTIQGLVDNPIEGKGLIAGYTISGYNHRPGFDWFFGRDSMWTSFALNSVGDFTTTRAALEFLTRVQRADGRVPHEIPQTASLVPWWKEYPYGFASADATPLYIIGVDDYVRFSGDVDFARAHWDNVWRAYQFLKSTYAPNGLPKNIGVGHGWIEGGALLPVSTELYQAGVADQALHSLSDIARLLNKTSEADSLSNEAAQLRTKIESSFWAPDKNFYGYALDTNGKLIDKPSVLGTVPMWFNLLDRQKGAQFLDVLAGPNDQADWGMRIVSQKDPLYSPVGYHFGSVWPLFTGWAAVADYNYHRALPGYLNLRANAQLVYDHSPGHATEVLSGDYYTPLATSSTHQIWSSAMIVSPIMRGMLGLSVDAINHTVDFAPHVPPDWDSFAVANIPVGATMLSLTWKRMADGISLEVQRKGSDTVQLHFAPAFSLRAKVLDAEVDGHRVNASPVEPANGSDQHVTINVPIGGDTTTIHVRVKNDFDIGYPFAAPAMGEISRGLRVLSEKWNDAHDRLELELAGMSGASYDLPLAGDLTGLRIEGGDEGTQRNSHTLHVAFPAAQSTPAYETKTVVLQFGGR